MNETKLTKQDPGKVLLFVPQKQSYIPPFFSILTRFRQLRPNVHRRHGKACTVPIQ